MLKSLARELTPPVVWRGISLVKNKFLKYGHSGTYASFEQALSESDGYDSVEAVAYAEAELERQNGHLSTRIMRLLAALQYVNAREGRLRVLDFGGSVGGLYFMTRPFLNIEAWRVCELPRMARAGRKRTDGVLEFTEELSDCSANVVLASGSVQYCRDPYQTLRTLLPLGRYVVLDRVPLLAEDRLTVQRVRPYLFQGSFPAWFLSEAKLLAELRDWRCIMRWTLPEHLAELDGWLQELYHGFLLSRDACP